MAFTNAEKQARWRERLRKQAHVLDGTPTKIADAILCALGADRTRAVIKALEKRLRNGLPHAKAADLSNQSHLRKNERQWRAMWKAEGRSLADYQAGLKDSNSEVWDWRRARGQAMVKAEREAWLRDHPGDPLPEHLCSLTGAKAREYDRWQEESAWRARRSSG
jgi:hypothetical protein